MRRATFEPRPVRGASLVGAPSLFLTPLNAALLCARSSARISETLTARFPATSLEAVAAEFAKSSNPKELNAKVAQLGVLVREEAAVAGSVFRSAEMWLRIKTPSVSDGNNFGVEVQNYVITELAAMRTAVDGFTTTGKDYHW